MAINSGDFALAVRAGDGWVLKEICAGDSVEYGLAVRCGGQWYLAPLGQKQSDWLINIKSGSSNIGVPLECADDGEGGSGEPCTGTDPLCTLCECASALREEYTVVLAGFPAICGVEIFNGSWTLTNTADCVWRYDIDDNSSVQLSAQAGVFWRVSWGVANSGGLGGYFGGYFGDECSPETHTYYYMYDYTPGCSGLSSALMTATTVVVV